MITTKYTQEPLIPRWFLNYLRSFLWLTRERLGAFARETNAWTAERDLRAHPTLSAPCCSEGLFTATCSVLESSALLHEVLTASASLFCMCSVAVNKAALMLSGEWSSLSPRSPIRNTLKSCVSKWQNILESPFQVLLLIQLHFFFFFFFVAVFCLVWFCNRA